MNKTVLAIVFALISLMILIPQTAGASEAVPSFGVQFHGTWSDYDNAEQDMVLHTLADNGATTVRIDVSWNMVQPDGPDTFSQWGLSQVDDAILAAEKYGLEPIVTLWMTPQWVTQSSDERTPPRTDQQLQYWKDFAGMMANRYHGRVVAWEIWNEPNHNDFMRGASPKDYAGVLNSAYAGIKTSDPDAVVVFGGTQYVDTKWIHSVFTYGGTNYDVMGVHPYQGVSDEKPTMPDNGTMYRMSRVVVLHELMVAHGCGSRPIWFTEFGWRANSNSPGIPHWKRGVTPQKQAAYLVSAIDYVKKKMPYVERVYWYTDRAESSRPKEAGYGLVFPNGLPSKALLAANNYFS